MNIRVFIQHGRSEEVSPSAGVKSTTRTNMLNEQSRSRCNVKAKLCRFNELPRVQTALFTVHPRRQERTVRPAPYLSARTAGCKEGMRVHLDRRDLDGWIEKNKC